MSDIIVWQVLDGNGQPIAIEFTDTEGTVYFVWARSGGPFWRGVRLGSLTRGRNGPFRRIEIARLPPQAQE